MMKSILMIQIILLMSLSFMNLLINVIPAYNKSIHPVMMGVLLLILMILCSLNIELYNSMNWMSYLMFLIFIGGLMIIFMYFISFINNMKMSIKWNFIKMLIIKLFTMMMMMMFILYYLNINLPWYNNSMEMMQYINQLNMKFYSMYMYMYNKNYSMILSMIYLLVTLIFIVKICINKKLSLRKIN
uniref:NADH dehydrogenase subunit 6 n=1 Tax=Chouioia cunea TaxID=1570515 RepID=A0A8B0R7A3_9HYME|nr:NADH dehydrogenase subunit 6 [Chouioia cunea]QTW90620.1 NADH dehydrogenase subunit 6 [Chouioia cunea]